MTNITQQHPFGTDITADDIVDLMANSRSWEDKYRHIIQLGKKLPPMDEALKNQSISVPGCESKVWLNWQECNGVYAFSADSDARIVKGLLAIILAAVHGKQRDTLIAFNFEHYFEQLDLLAHLSQSRSNGINAIITQIKKI